MLRLRWTFSERCLAKDGYLDTRITKPCEPRNRCKILVLKMV